MKWLDSQKTMLTPLPTEMNIEEPEQTIVTEPEAENKAANILPIPTE